MPVLGRPTVSPCGTESLVFCPFLCFSFRLDDYCLKFTNPFFCSLRCCNTHPMRLSFQTLSARSSASDVFCSCFPRPPPPAGVSCCPDSSRPIVLQPAHEGPCCVEPGLLHWVLTAWPAPSFRGLVSSFVGKHVAGASLRGGDTCSVSGPGG